MRSPYDHSPVKYINDPGQQHPYLISIKSSFAYKGTLTASACNLEKKKLSSSFREGDTSAWVGQEGRSQVALLPHALTLKKAKKPCESLRGSPSGPIDPSLFPEPSCIWVLPSTPLPHTLCSLLQWTPSKNLS